MGRRGGGIKRKYGRAKTLYRRLIESDQISEEEKELLTVTYQLLNPAELKRTINKKLDNLYEIYKKKNNQENINSIKQLAPSIVSFSSMAQKERFRCHS